MEIIQKISEELLEGEAEKVESLTHEALTQGLSPEAILREGLIGGMNVVGERFKQGELFVPEVLLAARAMQAGMNILQPHLMKGGIKPLGRIILGTVKGDLHDIGKNLVAMIAEASGFKVVDIGVDVPSETFLDAIQTYEPEFVGLSALLTTTMLEMKKTVSLIKGSDVKGKTKVIVGGAPVTEQFAESIGADLFAKDAVDGVIKIKSIMGIK